MGARHQGSKALLATSLVVCFYASPALSDQFNPDPKDVCVSSNGQYSLNKARLISKLLDTYKITSWSLDTSGMITLDEEMSAIQVFDFCGSTGRCAESKKADIDTARYEFIQFIGRATDPKEKGRIRLLQKPGVEPSGDPVADFFSGLYSSECNASPVASDPKAPPDHPKAPNQADQSAVQLSKLVVRDKVDNLTFGRDYYAYKGLPSATIGYDGNVQSRSYTATANGEIGYQLGTTYAGDVGLLGDLSASFIPFVGVNIKQVNSNPAPKQPNTDAVMEGVLVASNFKLFGFYHELQFYPEFTKEYRLGSDVLSGNFVYWPEPALPIIGKNYDIADAHQVNVSLRPVFSASYQHPISAGDNTALEAMGSYWRYGPGFDLSMSGFPGSVFQQFSVAASYRYFLDRHPQLNPISNYQSSLSYTPPGLDNFSVTFKYSVGNDLNTLNSVHEYIFGLGVKY